MSTSRPGPAAYLDHVAGESARFLDALRAAPAGARVPTCPDWDADDLLWHLAEVQHFWAAVVVSRSLAEPDEGAAPPRPADRAGLEAFFATAHAGLVGALRDTPPATPVWTWSDDRTAGFVLRRQAHEALVHRLDAELTAGRRTPFDPALAADGVDEALTVMFGGFPGWATHTPDPGGGAVRVEAADVGRSWLVLLGRWAGTGPTSGTQFDEPCLDVVADDGRPAATLRGTAADLDCVLWGRPPLREVERSGDERALALFEAVVAGGVQ